MVAAAGMPVERIDVLTSSTCTISGRPTPWRCRCRSQLRDGGRRRRRDDRCARLSRRPIRRRSAACCRAFRCASCRCASRRSAGGRRFDLAVFAPDAGASLETARRGTRQVWFDGGWRDSRDLVAARAAGRRDDRGPGDPRAARRHDGDRARPCRPRRRLGNLIVERPHERAGRNRQHRAAPRAICRTTSCIPTAPMAAPDKRAPRSPRCRSGSAAGASSRAPAACWIVATLFTLVPGRGGEPIISPHLETLRPVPAGRAISRRAPGASSSSMRSRPPMSRSRRSPIRPST